MRHFLLAAAASLAAAATANAQYIIWNSNVPAPSGAYVVNTPPFYTGLAFDGATITAFPVAPRYGYPNFYGYNPYLNNYPFMPRQPIVVSSNPGYNPYPQIWRP